MHDARDVKAGIRPDGPAWLHAVFEKGGARASVFDG